MPKHGTITMYKGPEACRCEPCRKAWSDYCRNRLRQQAYGRWQPYVDAGPVRDHLRALRDSGMGVRRIEELSGVAHPMVTRIRSGRTKQVRPETEARLLAVQPGSPAGGARVRALGASRRLQALTALGWTAVDLADRSELSMDSIRACVLGGNVTVRTADLVRDLYDRLWDQAPPESTRGERMKTERARARARRAKWPVPLAWDNIDDPDEKPKTAVKGRPVVDELAVELALKGEPVPLARVDVAEVVRIGTARGMSAAQLARVTGRTARSVQRRRAA